MIKSEFVRNILELTFDDFKDGNLLRQQIPFLIEREREHTGIGVFIYFNSNKEISNYKVDTGKITTFDIYGNPVEVLNGVEIRSKALSILADTNVYLSHGIIDHIEIWNKSGNDYPLTDPEHYELHQIWLDKSERKSLIK